MSTQSRSTSRQPRASTQLYETAKGRAVDLLLANAGRGLGHDFLDQDFKEARRVVDTNITGRSISSRR